MTADRARHEAVVRELAASAHALVRARAQTILRAWGIETRCEETPTLPTQFWERWEDLESFCWALSAARDGSAARGIEEARRCLNLWGEQVETLLLDTPDCASEQIKVLRQILVTARKTLVKATGNEAPRLEIEPGRYLVASAVSLITRITDLKSTRSNAKGEGRQFIMVDAGFVDLIRPAMYGSYHEIRIPAREGDPLEPWCVAGPMCESGDVFTRGANELLEPRLLPTPKRGDLLEIWDAGAYGYAMSSNYNSIGRAPQVWREEDGSVNLVSRRESLEDLIAAELDQPLR